MASGLSTRGVTPRHIRTSAQSPRYLAKTVGATEHKVPLSRGDAFVQGPFSSNNGPNVEDVLLLKRMGSQPSDI